MIQKDIDFIVLGRITIDLNPTDYYNTLDKSNNFQKYIGGSSANVAIGLSHLKNKVGFIGKISNDQFGKYVYDIFQKDKIDTTNIFYHNKYKLGLTFTEFLSKSKSNILMYRDNVADLELNSSEINEEYLKRAKVFFFSGTSLAKNPSRNAVFKAIRLSKKHNLEIVFDLDYRNYTWENIDDTSLTYFYAAKDSDILIGSIEEFKYASKYAFLQNKDNEIEMEEIAKYWLKTAKIVIIKDGLNGSYFFSKDKSYKVKIIPVKMLKGFGGGDAYASYFLHFYKKDKLNIKEALLYATAAASYMVTSHSSSMFPTIEELNNFINKNSSVDELIGEMNAFKK